MLCITVEEIVCYFCWAREQIQQYKAHQVQTIPLYRDSISQFLLRHCTPNGSKSRVFGPGTNAPTLTVYNFVIVINEILIMDCKVKWMVHSLPDFTGQRRVNTVTEMWIVIISPNLSGSCALMLLPIKKFEVGQIGSQFRSSRNCCQRWTCKDDEQAQEGDRMPKSGCSILIRARRASWARWAVLCSSSSCSNCVYSGSSK